MAYVIAGLVLVTLLGIGNLMLTLALIRRLRATPAAPVPVPAERQLVGPGERVGPYRVVTLDGTELSGHAGLVAFLSPSCPPCQEQLPLVVEHAAAHPGGVLAVVVDDFEDPELVAAEAAALAEVAPVVVARTGDRLTNAFGVDAYPALVLVGPDGRVVASGHDLADLPLPSRGPVT